MFTNVCAFYETHCAPVIDILPVVMLPLVILLANVIFPAVILPDDDILPVDILPDVILPVVDKSPDESVVTALHANVLTPLKEPVTYNIPPSEPTCEGNVYSEFCVNDDGV